MLYVGLDYHQRRSALCVLDSNGKKIESKDFRGHWPKVMEEMEKIKQKHSDSIAVCFEASVDSGYLHDRLRLIARRVEVAHPLQLRLIFRSKKKNDRVDAEKLAKLLFLDQVPPVYVPGEDIRSWRGIIEFRSRLVGKRTSVKNSIRSLLRSTGTIAPKKLWSMAGIDWLGELEMANELDQLRLDTLLEEFLSLKKKIARVEKTLGAFARRHPGIPILKSIPGIGIRTAEALIAYIDDPDRFSRTCKIGSYFGLVPSQDSSADRNRLGHITKQGPGTVRRLLTEAAWISIRRSPTVRAYFERITHGKKERRKIAVIATAHYLARVALCLLKTGELWREDPKVIAGIRACRALPTG